jgi:lipopolysaccharide transport system permease protein
VLYRLNPMLGVVTGFRWSMLGDGPPPMLIDVTWSGCFTALLLVGGLATFARLENFAVDRI